MTTTATRATGAVDPAISNAFLALVLAQAAHSVEEYVFRF